jgi:hypothetical protein
MWLHLKSSVDQLQPGGTTYDIGFVQKCGFNNQKKEKQQNGIQYSLQKKNNMAMTMMMMRMTTRRKMRIR